MARPSRERVAIEDALAQLPGWTAAADREAIGRSYDFPGFAAAFAFMTRIALLAERLDHHPEWRNVYGRVDVVLTTHDAGGITGLDLHMARAMDAAAA